MSPYRKLIAVLGILLFCWSANAFFRDRDTNNTGALQFPGDLYEKIGNRVVVFGLLTICPLAAVVNHIGWHIARNASSASWKQRIATLDKFQPESGEPEAVIYVAVFAFAYHIFPGFVAGHLLMRLFTSVPPATLWDFSVAGLTDGNAHRFQCFSYYTWITFLIIVLFALQAFTLLRLAFAVTRKHQRRK